MDKLLWVPVPRGPMMLNMFDMWNSVSTKLEAQSNVQQTQQPHTSGGSIKGNFYLITGTAMPEAFIAQITRDQDSANRVCEVSRKFSQKNNFLSGILKHT